MRNPFGMDEHCRACPDLVDTRTDIVHGYGDVTADFLLVDEQPPPWADAGGVGVESAPSDDPIVTSLARLGLLDVDATDIDDDPVVSNAFVTHLTRCRHPERAPTEAECENCHAFLSAEIRTVNPEVMIPIGQRPLNVIAEEFTTRDASDLEIAAVHGTPIRGRGFELLPTVSRDALTGPTLDDFVDAMRELMNRDYRQTKGRRRR